MGRAFLIIYSNIKLYKSIFQFFFLILILEKVTD